MPIDALAHPTRRQLQGFRDGLLADAAAQQVDEHLAGCAPCQAVLESLSEDALVLRCRQAGPAVFGATSRPADTGASGSSADPPAAIPADLADHPRYRILGILGAGGMGAVYKARHLVMDRLVALKVIGHKLTDEPAAIERFHREARAAARLTHPNIVAAYDADQAGGIHFLVMEFVEGVSLAKQVQDGGPLPVHEACICARQAALGLQHAFEMGMVHRDIKPHNLMRTPKGWVKILDFGLARFVSESQGADGLTQEGALMGTLDYLAPEQAEDAHRADIRADIYSLGCTLYFLLTGQPPFPGGSVRQKLTAHMHDPPRPVHELRPEVPPELSRIVERMLAKKPQDRYQTPAEVAQALVAFLRAPTTATPKEQVRVEPAPCPPPAVRALPSSLPGLPLRWRHRLPWVLGAAAAVVALLLGGVAVYRITTDFGVVEIQTDDDDVEVFIQQSGKRVAILDGKTKRRIELHAGTYEVKLKEGKSDLTLKTDQFVLKRGDKEIVRVRRVAEAVGEIRRLEGHHDRVICVAVSSDGRRGLSGGEDKTVSLWDLEGGRELRVFRGHRAAVTGVAFSPDGHRALSCSDDNTVRLWDLDGENELCKFDGHTDKVWSVTFSPVSSSRLALSGGLDNVVQVWNLDNQRQVFSFKGHTDAVRCIAVSKDGCRVLSGGHDNMLRLWDLQSGQEIRKFEHKAAVVSVAFSPDERFALSGCDDRTARLWDLKSGEQLRCLRPHYEWGVHVAFLPDGQRGVSSSHDGTVRLWDLATGKETLCLQGHKGPIDDIAVSQDGRLALTGSQDETIRVWRLPEAPRKKSEVQTKKAEALVDALTKGDFAAASKDFDSIMKKTLPTDKLEATWRAEIKAAGAFQKRTTVRADKSGGSDAVIVTCQFEKTPLNIKVVFNADDEVMGLWLESGDQQTPPRRPVIDPKRPVPADALQRKLTPLYELKVAGRGNPEHVPEELVAILGNSRMHHWGIPNAVAFSPDGKTLASGSTDNTVKIWDLASGEQLHSFDDHAGEVNAVAFSPDGKTLASGGSDGMIYLREVSTGNMQRSLSPRGGQCRRVAFSRDGKRLAAGLDDGTARIWNVSTGKELHSLPDHKGEVYSVAFHPKDETLATASWDGHIRIWNTATGKLVHSFKGHNGGLFAVAFSPDGKRLASGSYDGTRKLWDMANWQAHSSPPLLDTLGQHEGGTWGGAWQVVFSSDGKFLASASHWGKVFLCDGATGTLKRRFLPRLNWTWSLDISPDNRTLAIGNWDSAVRLWDRTEDEPRPLPAGGMNTLFCLAVSPDGRTLASGSADDKVRLWDIATGRELRALERNTKKTLSVTSGVVSVAFAPDSRTLALGDFDGKIKLWDVATGAFKGGIDAHAGEIPRMVFSPDGKTLASVSTDKTLKLWEVSTGNLKEPVKIHGGYVRSVAYSPDGKMLASAGEDKKIKLWEVDTGKERTLGEHADTINSLAFSPDGKMLASASDDRTIKLWDLSTGEARSPLAVPTRALSVAFSPDGQTVATTGLDGKVRLWNTRSGVERQILTLGPSGGEIWEVAFTPEGRHLVTANRNGTLYVLRLASVQK